MENKIINKEGYNVELEISLSKQEFNEYITKAYNKDKHKYSVQGFRKGKAPQYLIERIYGQGVFYDTAMDLALNSEYPKAIDQLELDVVDYPHIDLKDMDGEEGIKFSVKVDVKPDVKLGLYKGVEIEKAEVTVTDQDVQSVLDSEVEKSSRMVTIEDRAAQDKDTVIIDFEGFVDDVAFEGGQAEGHELVLGSNSFIPGFEEQIIGHMTNDEFDVNVQFPEEYHAENLKGKDAVFKVVLHEIKVKELPVIDDEFIKDISEFDTVEQFKEETKKKIKQDREKSADDTMRSQALTFACENATVDVPNAMIENAIDRIVENMKSEMQYGGYTLEQYFQYTGMNMDDFRNRNREQAKRIAVRDLVIEQIIKVENITVTDEQIEQEIQKDAELYKMEPDQIKSALGDYKKYYTDKIEQESVVDLIYSSAKKVKKLKEKKETVKKQDDENKDEAPKKKPAAKKSAKKEQE